MLTFFVAICFVSSLFRFYVKWFFLGLQYAIISILVGLVSLRSPGSAHNLTKCVHYFLWLTKIWGIKFNVKGRENIKKDSNYIIVCNHQSSFDMVCMFHAFPPNTRILSKIELYYTPLLGTAAWLGGAIFVDRKNHNDAINVLKKAVDQINQEKCNVWVFPEGTRTQGDTLLPFKKGGFHLAQQAQIPILPIVFSNYRSIVSFADKHFTTGAIQITVLPEISTEGLERSDVDNLTERVRAAMCKEYAQSKTTIN